MKEITCCRPLNRYNLPAYGKDFQDAADLLTEWSYEGTENEGRATKGSALAFLAKTYMARSILDGTAKAGDAEWALARMYCGKLSTLINIL